MAAYYNEIEPFAAAWLRELIARDLIVSGDVDERSIEVVQPGDLAGYTQCHFFAGIGVWSYALRNADWADHARVWTGSCPCQPFSQSGKGEGFDDLRHLWPAWHRLIRECRPDVCFGEQVADDAGRAWFDVVSADLEGSGYAVGATDIPAAGVGAPHVRQRLFFVADAERNGRGPRRTERAGLGRSAAPLRASGNGVVALTNGGDASAESAVDDTDDTRSQGHGRSLAKHGAEGRQGAQRHERATGFWDDAEWLACTDGKARPVEPGTFPLVTGAPARLGRLRGYGNAINAEVATAFIEAYLDIRET